MPHPQFRPHPKARKTVAHPSAGRRSRDRDPLAVADMDREPRFQLGAYVTDGIDLFEVLGWRHGRGQIGSVAMRLILEDCYTLRRVEFLLDKVRRRFRVVREAPPAAS